MPSSIQLELKGQKLSDSERPAALGVASRGLGSADPFIGPEVVRVTSVVDVSAAGRSAGGGEVIRPEIESADGASGGAVLALEAETGETLFINPQRFHEAAERRGALRGGVIRLDALQLETGAGRGLGGFLWRRVSVLEVADDSLMDEARAQFTEIARDWLGKKVQKVVLDGPSWVGARAISWAIESRLLQKPGLYRWTGAEGKPTDLEAVSAEELSREAAEGPLLLFLHGTASNTSGSFGDLRNSPAVWSRLTKTFGRRIYAFEHRSLSESPVENVLALAKALPAGARLRIVSHSRGGLIGDLLCLRDLAASEVKAWERLAGSGADQEELDQVAVRERKLLGDLNAVLAAKRFKRERFIRVACPARGTLLASANFDTFMSALLSVVGTVTGLRASGIYSALARLVLEVAKRRMDPQVIPGIEAMLPDSPLATLLARAYRDPEVQFAVIAGDIEGGSLWQRLGVLLTDWALFDQMDNDLVVDTDSMYQGLLRDGGGHALFDQGPRINHFHYFENRRTAEALVGWLIPPEAPDTTGFERVPGRGETVDSAESRGVRGHASQVLDGTKPVVFFLPGIMGSHLEIRKSGVRPGSGDRIWFDVGGLVLGDFSKLRYPGAQVEPEGIFEMFYGDLCKHLEASHHVIRFAFDWRKPIQVEAERLKEEVSAVLKQLEELGSDQPIQFLAHSMGGLVCRVMIERHPSLWDALVKRPQGRLVMLGTPNNGSHLIVQHLIGKAGTTRSIAKLDIQHSLQELLDIVATIPGALQLLPRPSSQFQDTAAKQAADYFDASTWRDFKPKVRDQWFGDGIVATPDAAVLDGARELWTQDLKHNHISRHPERVCYVFGQDSKTACGIEHFTDSQGRDALRILETPFGDGSVTWKSGQLDNLLDNHWWMPASHGDMGRHKPAFAGLVELLKTGAVSDSANQKGLNPGVPTSSRGLKATVTPFEPGPPVLRDAEELAAGLFGSIPPPTSRAPSSRWELNLSVAAGDVRFLNRPVLCGHYERDPIAGVENVLDRSVVNGGLRRREHLGLYAGPIGTATVVLNPAIDDGRQGTSRTGTIVVGLGELGSLTASSLTKTVQAGIVRLLLELQQSSCTGSEPDNGPVPVRLASLLLGCNSSTNILIEDSLSAVTLGVLAGSRQFAEAFPDSRLQVTDLEFIELYLDTAISAAHFLQRLPDKLLRQCTEHRARLVPNPLLQERSGFLRRLADATSSKGYWARLSVTADDPAPTGPLAQNLRYLFLSERARAEIVDQERQPGLLERLVADAIRNPSFNLKLSELFFHLLVPRDFKNHAREAERLVLLVDRFTANYPWEMLCADGVPLVTRVRLVRQLESKRFRERIQRTMDNAALVIGDPSTAGFEKVFGNLENSAPTGLPPLPGAAREANTVAEILRESRYETTLVGARAVASAVLSAVFQRPYRIIHVAAHGIVQTAGADGKERTGVVLSDGILLTAAEVGQLETVPDLVFLNCCHLGEANQLPTETRRIAYSLAREFIEMGVRCVVAAGWEVDDAAADLFAKAFYKAMVGNSKPFGDAVFEARMAVWNEMGHLNTWGAYQAYGDPTYRLNPTEPTEGARKACQWVSPREIEAEIHQLITRAHQRKADEKEVTAEDLETLLQGVPQAFKTRPEVQAAMGLFYGEIRDFKAAGVHLAAAASSLDPDNRLKVQVIEQLANMEARYGDASGDAPLVDRAIRRLEGLIGVTPEGLPGDALHPSVERFSILASALKRRSNLYLGTTKGKQDVSKLLRSTLARASAFYAAAAGTPDQLGFDLYPATNHLQLEALLRPQGKDHHASLRELAEKVREFAEQRADQQPDFFKAMSVADADLTLKWLSGDLPKTSPQLVKGYQKQGEHFPGSARKWDSVIRQLELLVQFGQALNADPAELAALEEIARALRPQKPSTAATPTKDKPAPTKRKKR